MNKLPKIYKQDINHKITNNNTVYYSTTKKIEKEEKRENIKEILDELFKESGYVFNKALIIKTKDKVYDTALVKRNSNYIYTLSDDKIPISDIVSIKRK